MAPTDSRVRTPPAQGTDDASGHYSRLEVLSLRIDHTPRAPVHKESHDDQPTPDAADIDHASL
jgi:hypothetical protein